MCEFVNHATDEFEKIIFLIFFCEKIWRRQFVHRIFAPDLRKRSDLALAIVSYLSRNRLVI